MPSIEESLSSKLNLEGYSAHTPQSSPVLDSLVSERQNPFIRCPVPQLTNTSRDSYEQAHLYGLVPQFRLFVKQQ